jgi:hypothetical protein
MVLVGLNVICNRVRRIKLVNLYIRGLWKVNGIQVFLGLCSVAWCRVGEVRSFLIFRIIREGNPLFQAIVRIRFHSRFLAGSVMGSVNIRLI